jgi:hypothetical protein
MIESQATRHHEYIGGHDEVRVLRDASQIWENEGFKWNDSQRIIVALDE